MSKVTAIILVTGIVCALLWSGVMVYAALEHNPQNEFTDHPEGLVVVFLTWINVVLAPFILAAGGWELYLWLRRKSGQGTKGHG